MSINKPNSRYEHVYPIVRLDHDLPVDPSHPNNSITVVKVVLSEELAQREVDRLNVLNGNKRCTYFSCISRLIPQEDDNDEAIDEAIEKGDRRFLEKMIARDPAYAKAVWDDNCLLKKAWYGNKPLLPLLLELGVSPDQANSEGTTVLMSAATDGDLEVLALLLKWRASINARNERGETAFSYAVTWNQRAAAVALYEAGADILCRDCDGATALDWAVNHVDDDFISWLKSIGVQFNLHPHNP